VIFPNAIDRAHERGDHALCDMLIGSWILFCALFYRSSTYAVLALLKREARRSTGFAATWMRFCPDFH
jgi:hypothetical protein